MSGGLTLCHLAEGVSGGLTLCHLAEGVSEWWFTAVSPG